MRLHRCIQLAIVATLWACSASTAPKSSTSQGTIAIPSAGGTVTLPSAGGYNATLQIASGAPSGVTITATASTTAPPSASVVSRSTVRKQIQSDAVPILYETLTVSADIAAQYFLSETFSTSSAPSAAGGLYYVSIVDATTGTSLGDFSAANPGGITGTVTVHDTYFSLTGGSAISFNPGDSYVFEFYYVPLASVNATGLTSSVSIGDTLQLALFAVYSDTMLPVATQGTWTSSNPSVATIDGSTGLVTGVSAGSVVMTGTFAGKSAADTLTVTSNTGGFEVQTVTASGNDTLFVSGGAAAFAVAAANMGTTSTGVVTVSTSTGGATLPLSATICQTSPNGQCLSAPGPTTQVSFAPDASATFSVFVTTTASITNNPTLSVLFTVGNTVIGSGSVIVKTQ